MTRSARLERGWLTKRKPEQPFIGGTGHVVIDTPAAVLARDLLEITKNAHVIIVPAMPSNIDIHVARNVSLTCC